MAAVEFLGMAKESIGQRLASLRDRSGMSMAETARAAGYKGASGYQRWEDADRNEPLPPKIARKLAHALAGRGTPPITEQEVLDLAGDIIVVPPLGETDEGMPVTGKVAAGIWQEHDTFDAPIGSVGITRDRRYEGRQYALQVEGESMNRYVPSGAYVIVVEAFGFVPRERDVVVVRRIRGDLIERTLKRVKFVNGKAEFHPESDDTRFEPIRPNGVSGITIEIEGYVIGRYLPA